jgi:hypothetical protein
MKNKIKDAPPAEAAKEVITKTDTCDRKAEKKAGKKAKKAALKAEKRVRTPMRGRDVALSFIISSAISFAIFILSPLCIIADNRIDFPLSFKNLMGPMAIVALINTVLVGGYLLLRKWRSDYKFKRSTCTLTGFLLAFFVQVVFINNKNTAISGQRASDNELTLFTIGNMVIFFLIVTLPWKLRKLSKKHPDNKYLAAADKFAVQCIAVTALVVQLGWAGVKAANTDFKQHDYTYTGYLSYEPSLSLSKDSNIVVFLVDRLDGDYMDKVLEDYPEVNDKLSGFTYYQNNISHSTNTFPSVPQMLTDKLYDGGEWPRYIKSAYNEHSVPVTLKNNGYFVNIIPDAITTVGPMQFAESFCDNVKYLDEDDVYINYTGEYGVVHALSKLGFSRLCPSTLKGWMSKGLGSNVARHFVKAKDMPDDYVITSMGLETDIRYHDYRKTHKLTADNPQKTFTFIHLSGSHYNSNTLAEFYAPVEGNANVYETTRGDFEILFDYFDELKELGIYDNTTIVILGDHGRPPTETDPVLRSKLKSAITTAILVKPAGAEEAPVKLDRYSELSNDFLPASILEYAGIDHSDYGYSINDVVENDLHPDRYLQTVKFENYGSLKYTALYKVTGDARDFKNWELMSKHENQ